MWDLKSRQLGPAAWLPLSHMAVRIAASIFVAAAATTSDGAGAARWGAQKTGGEADEGSSQRLLDRIAQLEAALARMTGRAERADASFRSVRAVIQRGGDSWKERRTWHWSLRLEPRDLCADLDDLD